MEEPELPPGSGKEPETILGQELDCYKALGENSWLRQGRPQDLARPRASFLSIRFLTQFPPV